MKFHGVVGYGNKTRVEPGVFEDVITEKEYFGDVTRLTNQQRVSGDRQALEFSTSHTISILADPYATLYFARIRFAEWGGVRWTVTSVEVQPPRLILTLGEVYNGPTAATSGTSGKHSG